MLVDGSVKFLKKDTFKVYRHYCEQFSAVYRYLKNSYNTDYVSEICQLRGYISTEQKALIQEMQLGKCEITDCTELGALRKDLGLTTRNKLTGEESFLLAGRYIVPINDIQGNLVALVGWYPDYKKYITTPSPFFSKSMLLFNIDQAYRLSWEKYNGAVILVEGIFDALSLRSIGLPAVATMGATVESTKAEVLKLFRKVVAMPDNDTVGKKAMARGLKESWIVPPNTTFLRLNGVCETPFGRLKVKDADNLVSYYDRDSILEVFDYLFNCKKDLEIVHL